MQDYLKVVVTGEVDSGKSTLIGRFLYEAGSVSKEKIEEIDKACQRLDTDFEFAYLLDSFEEERRGRLTIDTTQAFCKTKRGKELIFIDVPGHRELLKNMLCGASYADVAILVVDVQKSVEEQTKRHAFILKFLGIEQIILALNKMDSVGFNKNIFEEMKEETRTVFRKKEINIRYFVPISAKEGENLVKRSGKMSWHKGFSLIQALNKCLKKKRNSDFRFPIQDIYNLDGNKVAVGEIISGKIKKGEKVNIVSLNKECRIKEIKVFKENKRLAEAPESIGLLLDDMDGLRRGQVICKPELPELNTEITARIYCIHPLHTRESVRFKCSTQGTPARIKRISAIWDTASLEPRTRKDILEENDFAEVIIVAEDAIVVESSKKLNSLGRFVLQNNNKEICAVGIII